MNRIYYLILLLAATVSVAVPASAQRQMTESNRREWTQRMRDLKHNFLIEALDLTREQQNEFFPLYDSMEDELNAMTAEARELEAKIEAQGEEATNLEYTSAARTLFEQKSKENKVEMEYFEKFEKILTPRQLFLLKGAERNFMGQVVRRHGRMRNDAAGERGPRH